MGFGQESFAKLWDVAEEDNQTDEGKEVIVMKSYGEFYKNIEGGSTSNFLRRVNSPYFMSG